MAGLKTLSLVMFDVQGAFNGVHPSVFAEQLRERRIPGDLVAWTESFCNGRQALLVVGDYESTVRDIERAGMHQSSPLSPYCMYRTARTLCGVG